MAKKEKAIYDYCYKCGYDYENERSENVVYSPHIELGHTPHPKKFYKKFGQDAKWNYDAEYAGRAAFLKKAIGYNYTFYSDGHRLVASAYSLASAKGYAEFLAEEALKPIVETDELPF